jgi:phosphate-selective porin OprO/OprP
VFGLRGFGIGLAGTTAEQTGDSNNSLLPSIKSPGQQTVFKYRSGVIADGDRQRITPQLYYYRGSFGLIGEWVQVDQDITFVTDDGTRHDTVDTDAWQLAMSWFVTGEQNSFRGYTPLTTFTRHAPGWGAPRAQGPLSRVQRGRRRLRGRFRLFADPTVSARRALMLSGSTGI